MIDAKMVREIASKYIYDRCPAIVGVGKEKLVLLFHTGIHAAIAVARVLLRTIYFCRRVRDENGWCISSWDNLEPC